MKKFFLALLIALGALTSVVRAQTNSQLEKDVLSEINRVRTNPAAYAKWIADNRNNLPYQTLSDKEKMIDEAIRVLQATAPLPALNRSPIADKAASAHVADQLPTGQFNHRGTDGSMPDQRLKRFGKLFGAWGENAIAMNPNAHGIVEAAGIVLAWIIDDRASSGAHREYLLDRKYALAGVACGKYTNSKIYPDYALCVVDFAQQLQ